VNMHSIHIHRMLIDASQVRCACHIFIHMQIFGAMDTHADLQIGRSLLQNIGLVCTNMICKYA